MTRIGPSLLFSQDNPITIDSVSCLVEKSLRLEGKVHFRGNLDKDWSLVPKIARLNTIFHAGKPVPSHKLEEQERLLLHRFRRHSYEHRGRILNEWEALFLARHHDLPVRLLDWTSNPLVAAYFASDHGKKEENKNDGAIWWFRRPLRNMYVDVFEGTHPFDYRGIQMVFPFYPTRRMTAQSGVFTIHSPDYWGDLREMKKAEAGGKRPRRDGKEIEIDIEEGGLWIVPRTKKPKILQDLDRLGINARTLFPELDGLAKGLMQTERFREREEYQ